MHDATIFVCENANCKSYLIILRADDRSSLLMARLNGWEKAYADRDASGKRDADRDLWLCPRHS